MPLHFFERPFPSANSVLITGPQPILFDSGFGSDVPALLDWLQAQGTPAEQLAIIVNSHYHCDHAGGNHALQRRYHTPIAAHRWEGQLVNLWQPEACSARWLGQPVQAYQVQQLLAGDEVLETGQHSLQVIHTPGHSLGHISLFEPESRTLLAGDAVHADDVAWVGIFREGAGAILRAMESLDRLAALQPRRMISGHSALYEQPLDAIDRARRRYERWLQQPEKVAWHASKRIFTYAVMLENGMTRPRVEEYLLNAPWFQDFCRDSFHKPPADQIAALLAEILRSGAATWQGELLMPLTPYVPPSPGWLDSPGDPSAWVNEGAL